MLHNGRYRTQIPFLAQAQCRCPPHPTTKLLQSHFISWGWLLVDSRSASMAPGPSTHAPSMARGQSTWLENSPPALANLPALGRHCMSQPCIPGTNPIFAGIEVAIARSSWYPPRSSRITSESHWLQVQRSNPTQGCHGGRAISAMQSAAASGKRLAHNFRRRSRPSGCHGGLPTSSIRSRHSLHRGFGSPSTMYMSYRHFQHQKHLRQPKLPMETNPRETWQ